LTLRVEQVWGTAIGVDVRDNADPSAVLERVFAWFDRVDVLFSTWRDDSEISRIAAGALRRDDAGAEVRAVLDLCDEMRAQTRGAFDIAFAAHPDVAPRPGRGALDPSGLVKGWALERAAGMLAEDGWRHFSLNAGGDVLTRGCAATGEPWRVGIQHPWERHAVAAVVVGTDLAVATSGQYEQPDHIVVPATGKPAAGLTAVTVIGPDLARCDAYATAAVVLGDEGMDWIAGVEGYEAMGITDARVVLLTPGFDQYRAAAQYHSDDGTRQSPNTERDR
jgi:thiamine biosynthesis lipoprotein